MPFSPTPEFLGNSPRYDLAMWYFPPLFPARYIQDLVLSNTAGAHSHTLGPAKALHRWWDAQFRVRAVFLHTRLCIIALRTATQMFNELDIAKFRKNCQEKEKEKKKRTPAHEFCCLITDGLRSQEYLYFHSHFKGKGFPKSFSLLLLCQRWQ